MSGQEPEVDEVEDFEPLPFEDDEVQDDEA